MSFQLVLPDISDASGVLCCIQFSVFKHFLDAAPAWKFSVVACCPKSMDITKLVCSLVWVARSSVQFNAFVYLCNTVELDKGNWSWASAKLYLIQQFLCLLTAIWSRLQGIFLIMQSILMVFGCLGLRGQNYGIGSLFYLFNRCIWRQTRYGWGSDPEIIFLTS